MATYRIYFIGETVIRGRHDFDAENDQSAIQVAYVLLDACSDDCRSFDLWQDTRRVAVPRLYEPTTFDELSAANQERVVETEELIVQSEWRIAKSRRLLEALESKRGNTYLPNPS
jgi:hypothetical protein